MTTERHDSVPRGEHPRPQFVREEWLSLNGGWGFEIDHGDSGRERGLIERPLSGAITVPFCPESALSGVGNVDFMAAVWYRREVEVPATWAGKRALLHFQAVDYDATVWADGREVGRHRGGSAPFSCDLGHCAGKIITVVVRARDPKSGPQPRGKQSDRYGNHGCHYTRTTGIWQTVWLEAVPDLHLRRPRITPDVAAGLLRLEQRISNNRPGLRVRATVTDGQGVVCVTSAPADRDLSPRLDLAIPVERRRLWSVADPHLYGRTIELLDASTGAVVDLATSYAGLRSVTLDGRAIRINGEVVFQRLVLDQGYYPDGILTAPSEEALVADIRLSQETGFNGARLHQKVFEERFLYHADRMGYLVWGEFPDWGCAGYAHGDDHQQPTAAYITEWLEVLERDYSHPSIVGWCGLNETAQKFTDRVSVLDDVTRGVFLAARAMDGTRPVLDASGYSHRVPETDIYDSHDYEQDPAKFAANQAGLADGAPFVNGPKDAPWSIPYAGQPYFVSEFGGIWWKPDVQPGEPSWGYGQRPASIEEFYTRFSGLCAVLLDNPHMFGYCYTQLTDVYQEQNGIYGFDRSVKFDMARIRAAQERTAAIEQTHGAVTLVGKDREIMEAA